MTANRHASECRRCLESCALARWLPFRVPYDTLVMFRRTRADPCWLVFQPPPLRCFSK